MASYIENCIMVRHVIMSLKCNLEISRFVTKKSPRIACQSYVLP